MNTPREPLMLSDTAMVLLRQYNEVSESDQARKRDEILPFSVRNETWDLDLRQQHLDTIYRLSRNIRRDLAREIWILWNYPDICPIRSLNWHIVLNDELMKMGALLFDLPRESAWAEENADIHQFFWREQFVNRLKWRYQAALRNRTGTVDL